VFRYNNPGLFPRIRKLKSIQPRTFEEDMAALDKKEKRRRNKEEKIRLAAEARQREEDEMKQRHAASSRKYLKLVGFCRACAVRTRLFKPLTRKTGRCAPLPPPQ
jgi:hypothetical protein